MEPVVKPPRAALPRAVPLPDEERINTPELLGIVKRLPAYARVIYALYRNTGLTRWQKVLLTTALGYLISPVDLVPGFIPVAGQLDDILIVLAILIKVIRALPRPESDVLLENAGLSRNIVEQDFRLARRTARLLAVKTGKVIGAAAMLAGKGVVRTAHELARTAAGVKKPRHKHLP